MIIFTVEADISSYFASLQLQFEKRSKSWDGRTDWLDLIDRFNKTYTNKNSDVICLFWSGGIRKTLYIKDIL